MDDKIKDSIREQFVEDYKEIKQFMCNVNNTLEKLGVNDRYLSYNEFCIDIENNLIKLMDSYKQNNITPKIMSEALNTMIKLKILEDNDYEEKLKNYFDKEEKSQKIIKELKEIKTKNKKRTIKRKSKKEI